MPVLPLVPTNGFEQRISDLRANARSGIADGHANTGSRSIPAFVRTGNADFQRTAAPDGVHGIGYQIQLNWRSSPGRPRTDELRRISLSIEISAAASLA